MKNEVYRVMEEFDKKIESMGIRNLKYLFMQQWILDFLEYHVNDERINDKVLRGTKGSTLEDFINELIQYEGTSQYGYSMDFEGVEMLIDEYIDEYNL